jgi:hypothetical protein
MLGRLMHLSQEMLSLAQQGEWERVTEMQVERQTLIENTFPLDAQTAEVDDAAGQIQSILDLDQQITRLARAQQEEIGRALSKLSHGRVATKAYQDTSRG